MLDSQARKLDSLAASIENWHDSSYGNHLRFCDKRTFRKVSSIWKSYFGKSPEGDTLGDYSTRLEVDLQAAKAQRRRVNGKSNTTSGFRSAAPLGFEALQELPLLHEHFWTHGVTDEDVYVIAHATQPNLTFASLAMDTRNIHYGTDPLLGFHLAAAYAPWTRKSPSSSPSSSSSSDGRQRGKVVEAARLQFSQWCHSFRRFPRHDLKIRLFSGDAINFSYTLQHMSTGEDTVSANYYYKDWSFEPLVLDGGDYSSRRLAPHTFNVIDTSNLIDHLGTLNLLIATTPLLENCLSSSLYTEILVKQDADLKTTIDNLLCGDFTTMSLLLGLFPVEFWTNGSAIASLDEGILDTVVASTQGLENGIEGQMRFRLHWRKTSSVVAGLVRQPSDTLLHLDESGISRLLYQTYLKMFPHENLQELFSNMSSGQAIKSHSAIRYHRGSVAALLGHLKRTISVDWRQTIHGFLELVEGDQHLIIGKNYIQELYLYLHLFDLYTVSALDANPGQSNRINSARHLRSWGLLPSVLCITLLVPRGALGVLTNMQAWLLGTPALSCSLESSSSRPYGVWQNTFAMLQMAFGRVEPEGERGADDFRIRVIEDTRAWKGTSSLIVSFLVPTWIVLLEPQTAQVSLDVQSTPHSASILSKALGPTMKIHKTSLGDEANVFITRYRPHQSDHASLRQSTHVPEGKTSESKFSTFDNFFTAELHPITSRISKLVGRATVLSEEARLALVNNGTIITDQISPMAISITLSTNYRFDLQFPAPVCASRGTVRIARKSGYIEVVAPVLHPLAKDRFSNFLFPTTLVGMGTLKQDVPLNWNMPYLNLDRLSELDTSMTSQMKWLITHTSLMFSSRERAIRESAIEKTSRPSDTRIDFKDGLFSLFMHYTGLQGKRARVFALNRPGEGGTHVLIFVSSLKMDMANHTVVLDAVVLPLTDKLIRDSFAEKFLAALSSQGFLCAINVTSTELRLWKTVLPAFVERCRTWQHLPERCEYLVTKQIPILSGLNDGQTPLCSCGHGHFPTHFLHDLHLPCSDRVLRKYATRVAISPCFAVPYVEDCFHRERYRGIAATMKDTEEGLNCDTAVACRVCGKLRLLENRSVKLLRCGRCRKVQYCSTECQKSDWKQHQKICSKA